MTLLSGGGGSYLLIGLIHGHYGLSGEIKDSFDDETVPDSSEGRTVNMGIGIVCTVQDIKDVLDKPELVKQRADFKTEVEKQRASQLPEMD